MAIHPGIMLAFLAMLCWGIGDFLIQRSTRKVGDIQALAAIGIVGSIGLIPFIIGDFYLLSSAKNLLLLIGLGVITFITSVLNFEALKEGKLSIIDVILEIELPITVGLSFFFFRETLTAYQFMIIGFVLLGIILIATKTLKIERMKLEKGVILALITALFMGVVNFMTASSSKMISPLMAIWVPWVVITAICLYVVWKRKELHKFSLHIGEHRWLLLAMGIFDTAAWIFYAYAVQGSSISVITAITESYPAVAMMLGLWLNKESLRWHQYLGAGLALVGSIVLSTTI